MNSNLYEIKNDIEVKLKIDLIKHGHNPNENYFTLDKDEVSDFIKLCHALPKVNDYNVILQTWTFYTTDDIYRMSEKMLNDYFYDMLYYDFDIEDVLGNMKDENLIDAFVRIGENDLWLIKER